MELIGSTKVDCEQPVWVGCHYSVVPFCFCFVVSYPGVSEFIHRSVVCRRIFLLLLLLPFHTPMNDNRRQHKPHHRRLFGTTIRPREIVQGIQVVGAIVLVAIFMINVRFLAHTRSDRFLHRRHHLPGWNINGTSGQERNESQSMNRRDEQNSVPINVSIDRTDEILSIFRQPAPWRQSRVVPPWMKDYMQWHQDQRADLTAKNWNNGTFRFLVVRCSRMDTKCGGTADRLKPLPFYLLVANHLKRILCVWWEKPTSVESLDRKSTRLNSSH